MKKIIVILFIMVFLTSCSKSDSNDYITVFSAGDYINPDILDMFTEETGIKVIYEEYDTNENMYTKISSPNSTYDLICTSDYMIEKLLSNDMLSTLNKNYIPNYKYMNEEILNKSKNFDPSLEYTMPYAYGTLGILYNSKYISEEEASSWNILWNEKYKNEILMMDSVRDIMAVALKRNGYSLNTSNEKELSKAEEDLITQKKLVQAYTVDQTKDKMIGEEAKVAVLYSGEAIFVNDYNDNLQYSVPKEGSNIWIDSWVTLKNSTKKDLAYKFLNFLARPDISTLNYDYLTYSTPNMEAIKLTENDLLKTSPIAIPPKDIIDRCELMKNLTPQLTKKYNEIFMNVKIHD